MEDKHKITGELAEISPLLAEITRMPVYQVPDGYFQELAGNILTRLNMEALPINMPNSVPAGYFDGLAATVLERVRQQKEETVAGELDAVAPLLNTISKANVYMLPAGYFETLPGIAFAKSNTKKPARIFGLRTARRWMQYAAAAVFAGVLVTGAFLYTDTNDVKNIDSYKQLDVTSGLGELSENELQVYLENHERLVAGEQTLPASYEEMPDVKKHITLLSDEELNQYLSENADTELIRKASISQ